MWYSVASQAINSCIVICLSSRFRTAKHQIRAGGDPNIMELLRFLPAAVACGLRLHVKTSCTTLLITGFECAVDSFTWQYSDCTIKPEVHRHRPGTARVGHNKKNLYELGGNSCKATGGASCVETYLQFLAPFEKLHVHRLLLLPGQLMLHRRWWVAKHCEESEMTL